MWFAVLDGLVIGAVVALLVSRPWRRDRVGGLVALLLVGVAGGVVGAGLGYTLATDSTATGPLQVTPIIAAVVGAALTLVVLRSWVVGDRAAAAAAVEAERRRVARAAREERKAARRQARPPSALAELVVLVLAARRR